MRDDPEATVPEPQDDVMLDAVAGGVPAWGLPSGTTQTGLRSNSAPGGGGTNADLSTTQTITYTGLE